MNNRKHRQELSNLIGKYLKCEIDNFTFDDGLWDLRDSDDKTVVIISEQCWYFYDDCSKHKNQDKHKFCELWETMVENWLKLLETDLEHDIPSKKWSIWDFMKNCVSFFRGDIPLFVQYPY
ncbi:MAG: hypothetical protein WC637_04415, partial [Victivallales bacterium]